MLRIARTVSTIAVLVATAGLIVPVAAQARAAGIYPYISKNTGNLGFTHKAPSLDNRLGARVHDTPLANPVEQPGALTVRTVSTDTGIDWTFPLMGAIALGLVLMIVGEQVLVRRRGRLAT
jgi:hypothetical protein